MDTEARRPIFRKKLIGRYDWVAPEHRIYSLGMERDRNGDLILDVRPMVMRPERPKIDMRLFADQKW